jgi:D-alanyl-D-alanine dipeptidase
MIYPATLPIPFFKISPNWRKIKIEECGEELIPLDDLKPRRIIIDPIYYKGLPKKTKCYVREKVARLLCEASTMLPLGWKICIFDAWRPLKLQKLLYKKYRAKLKQKYPNISEKELNRRVVKYVSFPSLDPTNPPPHLTGGAVDLTLVDKTGKKLEMGTEFDTFSRKAHTRFYEVKLKKFGKLKSQELLWLKNRRILFHLLSSVGFTNYPREWWHFDYGDQFWADIKKTKAIYGIIFPKR